MALEAFIKDGHAKFRGVIHSFTLGYAPEDEQLTATAAAQQEWMRLQPEQALTRLAEVLHGPLPLP